jgi:hypothetical protein
MAMSLAAQQWRLSANQALQLVKAATLSSWLAGGAQHQPGKHLKYGSGLCLGQWVGHMHCGSPAACMSHEPFPACSCVPGARWDMCTVVTHCQWQPKHHFA